MTSPTLVWLRQDLRLDDQPAIAAAAAAGPFAALYVLDDEAPGDWAIGGAQRWWLHHSLVAFRESLERRGGRLLLRRGSAKKIVAKVADELGAPTVHATAHYEPWWRETEQALGERLALHSGDTLVPLDAVRTGSGQPFKIYGPFYRALSALDVADPVSAPQSILAPDHLPESDDLADWQLLPTKPDWATGFSIWEPGEDGAQVRLERFEDAVGNYAKARDLPSEDGTSMLSPHLHFGEISPRRIYHSLRDAGGEKFLKELAWRDFARSAVLADPDVGARSQRNAAIRWRSGKHADADFLAWTRGMTGYPIVDAGMRQLWALGWMHNRVRMLTASFLVKHLLIDWRRGERWFWDTLVDADYGNNSLNWQWIAGTGTDSQPFNRVMAPLSQSAKFNAAAYIRQWVPELKHLSDEEIHDPPNRCGYPEPLIGHQAARERALAARGRHG